MITARELAELLNLSVPTDQQQAVIEAPLTPALVVAGAGSGKTETMANRVVWLLANGMVRVDEVLGLTFTRKAAGELATRIADRIAQLREKGLLPSEGAEFEHATVSTYNSFANAIFRENALLVGREPESVLLSEPSAWLLARRVVVASTDERLIPIGRHIDQLTEAVLELSHELSENVADPRAVSRLASDFGYLADIPFTDGRAKRVAYASVTKAVDALGALPVLVDLAEQYASEKRRRGLVEYSDQVALALAVCERSETVVASYLQRFRVVLLDEYQDTSVVQTRLLARLFGGHGVMAVGDPHQSIYGWRGASAANLARFPDDFGAGAEVPTYSLSTSWRNAGSILAAANILVEPLRLASTVAVRSLVPRAGAPVGTVTARYAETIENEASGVAQWVEAELHRPNQSGKPRSAAILFRNRRHMGLFANALETRGVPHHVLGLGGLLSTPEIVDLVSALRVTNDPTAGSELIRLLSGAHYAIGVRDLQELALTAGWLHSLDWSQHALRPELKQRMRDSVSVDDERSILDALDFVAEAPPTHSRLSGFSELGLARLRAAGRQLAFFRSRAGLGLLETVRLIEQELLLDIEVAANESSGLGSANLHAFQDEVTGFLAADDTGTLGGFLAWLAHAERQDTMGPRSDAAEDSVVQLLTIHGAKGLEWDSVVVPRLVVDELPNRPREGTGWLRFGKLPYEFRGDSAELPMLAWRGLDNQQQFDASVGAFSAGLADRHQAEERRLAYVAVTRARDALLLTGSFWVGTTRERVPSCFLVELAERGIIGELPGESESGENPSGGNDLTATWPLDALGGRRARVERAASLVAAADADADAGRWQRDIDLLLAERERAVNASELVALPSRVPASRFKDFVTDPASVAASLRRPMPVKPYRATKLGTVFHSWVEHRYHLTGQSDLIDAALTELDEDLAERSLDEAELTRLKAIFENSEFATLGPEDVELEIHLVLDGQVIVCKLDAVYLVDGRFRIVDWKTGMVPKDDADLEQKQLQLALYRQAFAEWKGIDPNQVDAVFYYVSDDRVIRPAHIYDRDQLVKLWRSIVGGH